MSRSEDDGFLTDEFLNRAAVACYNLYEMAAAEPEHSESLFEMVQGVLLLVGHVSRPKGAAGATMGEVIMAGHALVDARLTGIADEIVAGLSDQDWKI